MKMFTGRAEPIRIIGDSDNQRPDMWRCTILKSVQLLRRVYSLRVLYWEHELKF